MDIKKIDNNKNLDLYDKVIPSFNQYRYQKDELAIFIHFGPNTFNEIEWGENYGSLDVDEIFRLKDDFDATDIVKTIHDAGFKKIIITAKHHDGFCIWPSKFTKYSIKNTKYKNGNGDILKEISIQASKYDIDMGLYLSPWDIHEISYGYYDKDGKPTTKENDYLDYNDYYTNQLEEILSNPIYGNKGRFVEVWMDGAKGSGSDAQEYDFDRYNDIIQKYQGKKAGYESDCMIFGAYSYTTVRWVGNEDGFAHKDTWSKVLVDYEKNDIDSNLQKSFYKGYEDGNKWAISECDARITSGWFWGEKKKTPKTIKELAGIYFNSIGHNSTLLLNIPPNNKGKLDLDIKNRLLEFGENVRESFNINLLKDNIKDISIYNLDNKFYYNNIFNLFDGSLDTFWHSKNRENKIVINIKLNKEINFDIFSIEEEIRFGQKINYYEVKYKDFNTNECKILDKGETIGAKRLIRSDILKSDEFILSFSTNEDKFPILSNIGAYKASKDFELNKDDKAGIKNIKLEYKDDNLLNDEINFISSKFFIKGDIRDGNNYNLNIEIDDKKYNLKNIYPNKKFGYSILFESDDLEYKEHKLKIREYSDSLILKNVLIVDDDNKGILTLEKEVYTMKQNSEIDVKIIRLGGLDGSIKALLQPNPGTAIQDNFYSDLIVDVDFKDNQREFLAKVKTKSIEKKDNDVKWFTINLIDDNSNTVISPISTARIYIE